MLSLKKKHVIVSFLTQFQTPNKAKFSFLVQSQLRCEEVCIIKHIVKPCCHYESGNSENVYSSSFMCVCVFSRKNSILKMKFSLPLSLYILSDLNPMPSYGSLITIKWSCVKRLMTWKQTRQTIKFNAERDLCIYQAASSGEYHLLYSLCI